MDKYNGLELERDSDFPNRYKTNNQISILNAIFSTFIYISIINISSGFILGENLYRWVYLIVLITFVTLFFYSIKIITSFNYDILDNINIKNIILAFTCAIVVFITNFFLNKFILINTFKTNYENLLYGFQYFKTLHALIYVCLLGPIWEELLNRGYILKGLRNKYGTIVSLFLSSFLFALSHLNIVQGINAFIMGIVFGLLFIKTESVFICMLAHIINNSIAMYIMLF